MQDIEKSDDENSYISSIERIKTGPIRKFVKDLGKKRPDLKSLLLKTINKAEKDDDLKDLERSSYVQHLDEDIWEFRIPPQRPGGVLRLYFAYDPNDRNHIKVLTCELKKKVAADKEMVKIAKQRYKEVFQ